MNFPVILKLAGRISPLLLLNAGDSGVPLIRMVMLSHFLDLRELGFASLLTAVYSSFELITDINISRFVISAPREKYEEALAAAHALSALRGLMLALAIVAFSPFIAAAFSLGSQWPSFAALGLIVLLRSLEHLGPRIAERDYRYAPQFKVATVSWGMGLAALFGSIFVFANHLALIAALVGQMVGLVVATRLFASTPYRWRFRTPLFARGFYFGYPLMFNGLGLAVSAQADRFLVGAMLGLPALGVYSVLMVVTSVPVSIGSRIIGSVTLPMLLNSDRHAGGASGPPETGRAHHPSGGGDAGRRRPHHVRYRGSPGFWPPLHRLAMDGGAPSLRRLFPDGEERTRNDDPSHRRTHQAACIGQSGCWRRTDFLRNLHGVRSDDRGRHARPRSWGGAGSCGNVVSDAIGDERGDQRQLAVDRALGSSIVCRQPLGLFRFGRRKDRAEPCLPVPGGGGSRLLGPPLAAADGGSRLLRAVPGRRAGRTSSDTELVIAPPVCRPFRRGHVWQRRSALKGLGAKNCRVVAFVAAAGRPPPGKE